MAQRGRKSADALAITPGPPVSEMPRPDPPDDLREEEGQVWVAVTSRLPADWFPRETHEMLAQYCRHAVRARRVSDLIAKYEDPEDADSFEVEEYDRLLKMQERESRCLASLATRMRLTQQATYDAKKSKGKAGAVKPWES